jgi:hypothetical protein
MARMPEAIWTPKAIGSRARRAKGRGVVYHVAVSEAQNLMPGPDADWHFYVAKDGRIYQYIDTDFQAWATRDGNASMIAVETQGGVNDPQGEPWTAAQLASLAGIARFAHVTEGVPLRLMQSSRTSERGLGWHRLGCDPVRAPGGELWSSAYGKVCPGDAKIAQMPEVLRLALGSEDDMPSADEVADALLNRVITMPDKSKAAVRTVIAAIRQSQKSQQTDLDDIQSRLAAIETALDGLGSGGYEPAPPAA